MYCDFFWLFSALLVHTVVARTQPAPLCSQPGFCILWTLFALLERYNLRLNKTSFSMFHGAEFYQHICSITQNQPASGFTLNFLITVFFCPWKNIRTTHIEQMTKIQSPFKNRHNNDRRHSPSRSGGLREKRRQLPRCQSGRLFSPLNFQSVNCLLPCRTNFYTKYTTAHRREGEKNSTQARDKITFVQK